jgi:4-amino-4-deoxychorismate lyase
MSSDPSSNPSSDPSSDPDFGGSRAVCFVDGRPGGVDPRDRGLAYGDGLFETMLCRAGTIRWIDYHLERLVHGCRRLAIPAPDLDVLRSEIEGLCRSAGSAVVKLTVTRGVSERGYRVPEPASPSRILSIVPWSGYPSDQYTRGVTVRVCALRLGENPQLAGLKHLCRIEQVLAQMELTGVAAEEGLLRDRSGYVAGGITTNLFAVRGRMLFTPPLTRCGVHGVMRRLVMERAADVGLELVERELELAELERSEELFVTNAVAGIRPVARLDEWQFEVGPHTRALMTLLDSGADA